MSGIYDVTLSASSTAAAQIGALGSLVKVVSAPAGAVTVRLDGGDAFKLLEGQGLRLPDGTTFRDVQVNNASGIAQTVLIFIGDSRFEDTRVTGSVKVIDQSVDKTLLALQFHGSASAPVSAPSVSVVFLKPGTRSLVVKAIALQSLVAGDVMLGYGAADGTIISGGNTGTFANKLVNGAASQAIKGTGNSAAGVPTGGEAPGYATQTRVYVPASQLITVPLTTPFVLQGTGRLYISGLVINRDVSAVFDVEEAT